MKKIMCVAPVAAVLAAAGVVAAVRHSERARWAARDEVRRLRRTMRRTRAPLARRRRRSASRLQGHFR